MILKTACIDNCKTCDSKTTCNECNTNYKLADDQTCCIIKYIFFLSSKQSIVFEICFFILA